MASPVKYQVPELNRRQALTLLTSALTCLYPATASALRRANYGGELRLSLPVSLSRLDPHSSRDLACGLFGSSLFESLYAKTAQDHPYSTLAAKMPEDRGAFFQIELRPSLTFSDGTALTSREVVASILRSQALSSHLSELGKPITIPREPLLIRLPKLSLTSTELAAQLASPRAAILPQNFSSNSPIGCGALKVKMARGRLALTRNAQAPRGGSFLETVEIKSVSITDALRDFESYKADLGFLGRGLHQPRRDTSAFQLEPLGLVVVQPGRGADLVARPGQLHAQLARLPQAPFAALATARVRTSPAKWGGPSLRLMVDAEQTWLLALAKELSQSWSVNASTIQLEPVASEQFERRLRSRDFDLAINALSTSGISKSQASRDLFALDGRSPPRGGRIPPPEEACRQLSLGLLGELRPHGALAPKFIDLTSGGAELDLANVKRVREK